jgi:exodeoxyribonuclease VII small subunit
MTNDPKKFDFTQSINTLEDINSWFQNEDINLDEGLQKLKEGKELIKKCRTRLREFENEFVQIKKEFAEENSDAPEPLPNGQGPKRVLFEDTEPNPDDTPFQ